MRMRKIKVIRTWVRREAIKLSEENNISNFKASTTWYNFFLKDIIYSIGKQQILRHLLMKY